MTDTTGGPAFPIENAISSNARPVCPGMTLLDYFAGQALAGVMSRGESDNWRESGIAEICYSHAYSLIQERKEWQDGQEEKAEG